MMENGDRESGIGLLTILLILSGIAAVMLAETALARANERALIAGGAAEPRDDVISVMRLAYPGSFLVMAAEGLFRGSPYPPWLTAGIVIFALAKGLKYWAIASLGRRWTFRVLVPRGEPLVATGPYRFLKHPNYVAVAAEHVGAILMFGAPLTGAAATAFFVALMRRRIAVEERALGLRGAR